MLTEVALVGSSENGAEKGAKTSKSVYSVSSDAYADKNTEAVEDGSSKAFSSKKSITKNGNGINQSTMAGESNGSKEVASSKSVYSSSGNDAYKGGDVDQETQQSSKTKGAYNSATETEVQSTKTLTSSGVSIDRTKTNSTTGATTSEETTVSKNSDGDVTVTRSSNGETITRNPGSVKNLKSEYSTVQPYSTIEVE